MPLPRGVSTSQPFFQGLLRFAHYAAGLPGMLTCAVFERGGFTRMTRLGAYSCASLRAHALRSFFTILSIALGVTSVTLTTSVIEGSDLRLEEFAEWFGADAAFVTGGDIYSQPVNQRPLTLTAADVEAVRLQMPGVSQVTAGRNIRSVDIGYGGANYVAKVLVGSSPPFCQAWNWLLAEGEDLSEADSKSLRKVCLLGDTVSRELFGDRSPVGETVSIGKHLFVVKGRLAPKGFSSGQADMDDRVIVSLNALIRYFRLDTKYVNGMRIRFLDKQTLAEDLDNLRGLLRQRHGIRPGDQDDFSIVSSSEIIRFLTVVKHGVGLFLWIFSAITLLVGGVVLANLSYVIIEQRRQEIGILKAIGACNTDIAFQFFVEIVVLCLLGSLGGMALGMGAAAWINQSGVFTVSHSFSVWLSGLAGASAVALVFGIGPAQSAARMDPVASLGQG